MLADLAFFEKYTWGIWTQILPWGQENQINLNDNCLFFLSTVALTLMIFTTLVDLPLAFLGVLITLSIVLIVNPFFLTNYVFSYSKIDKN